MLAARRVARWWLRQLTSLSGIVGDRDRGQPPPPPPAILGIQATGTTEACHLRTRPNPRCNPKASSTGLRATSDGGNLLDTFKDCFLQRLKANILQLRMAHVAVMSR